MFIDLPFPEGCCINSKLQAPNYKKIPNSNIQMFGVWVIGYSDLDIVCYLLFGAWDFFFNHCTISAIKGSLNLHTSATPQRIPEIGVAVSAKIKRDGVQICESP
jgi:hypothetical protein